MLEISSTSELQLEDSNMKSMDILKAKVAFPAILVLQISLNLDIFLVRPFHNPNKIPTIILIMIILGCLASSIMIYRAVKNDVT
jgi:hypothetical protein